MLRHRGGRTAPSSPHGASQGCAVFLAAFYCLMPTVKASFLMPDGDAEALAERLCELASQPERVERMGQASRELYLANYTEEAAWPKLSALYDGLITKGRSTS